MAERANRARAQDLPRTVAAIFAALAGNGPTRPVGSVCAVLLGTFMTSLFTREFGVSLADIRGAYGLSVDQGAWLSTVFNAAQLVSAPAVPLLVLIFGARRILVGSALVFIVASGATPFVSGIPAIFVLHALDGLLLGCLVPASLAIVFGSLSPRFWLAALGVYSVRVTLSLHTGVSLSGLYVDAFDWRAIYWQATGLGVLFLLLAMASFERQKFNDRLLERTNTGEIAMYCAGLALIYAGLDQGNRLDWMESGTVVALLSGGALLFIVAVAWQFLSPLPFAHPAALAKRNIALPLAIVTIYGTTNAVSTLLVPGFLAVVADLKPIQTGSALLIVDAVQIAAIPATIWAIRKADIRLALAAGLLLVVAGCLLGRGLSPDWRGEDFAIMNLLVGAGNAAVLLACIAMTVANAGREELRSLVAYIQVPRLMGPEIGVALLSTLLRQRGVAHTVWLTTRGKADAMTDASGTLADAIGRQATVYAYCDAFAFCTWAAIVGLLLAAFIGKTPPHPLAKLSHTAEPG